MAIRVYEAAGLRAVHRSWALGVSGACVDALPAPAETLEVEAVDPADDGLLEQRFGLERGAL